MKFRTEPGGALKLGVRAMELCLPVRSVKLCAGVPATPGMRIAS